MNDLHHATTLFLVFALAVVLYGAMLALTGSRDLVPLRAAHSIRNPDEVRQLGRIVVVVGIVIGVVALVVRLFAG